MDITKNKTQLTWQDTYDWTEVFFNKHPELKIGAEIGVAGGQHIKHLLDHTSLEKILGVDPYVAGAWNVGVDVSEFNGVDGIYEYVRNMLGEYGDRAKLIRAPSLAVAKTIKDQSLDFVFIDALHDYKNCYADIVAWEPKVKEGGYIMGHDWDHSSHPDVSRAAINFFGREKITGVKGPYHIWYVQQDKKV